MQGKVEIRKSEKDLYPYVHSQAITEHSQRRVALNVRAPLPHTDGRNIQPTPSASEIKPEIDLSPERQELLLRIKRSTFAKSARFHTYSFKREHLYQLVDHLLLILNLKDSV